MKINLNRNFSFILNSLARNNVLPNNIYRRHNFVMATRVLSAIGVVLLASCRLPEDEKPSTPVVSCSSLAEQLSLPDTTIESAVLDSSGEIDPAYPNAGPRPEHCLIKGIIGAYTSSYTNPDTGSNAYGTRFELRLPTNWNGRFFYQGGGGFNGSVRPAVGFIVGQQDAPQSSSQTPALWRNFAVVSSDSGHHSSDTAAASTLGGFGVDPQARINYGYASIGQVTPVAKQIINKYYDKRPAHSYFLGCSKGGQEAMQVSQRYGDQFDGIVAGDPGFKIPTSMIANSWDTQTLADVVRGNNPSAVDTNGNPLLALAFSASDLDLIRKGVVQACDGLDGNLDGIIFNTKACEGKFNPASLQCPSAKNDSCLSADQVTAVNKIMGGAKAADNSNLSAAFPYDTGLTGRYGWRFWYLGSSPTSNTAFNITLVRNGGGYIFSAPPNSSLDPFTANLDQMQQNFSSTYGAYSVSAFKFMNSDSTNVDTFKARGGKILYFHGMSDATFSANGTIDYYNKLSKSYGKLTPNFARLFLIPGMTHCFGGPQTTNYFDTLDTIVDWVEHGKAPDTMTAGIGAIDTENTLPRSTVRPLCAYPKYAHYKGSGDVNDPVNYSCTNL